MKRPKLPKKVFFIDLKCIKLEDKRAWRILERTLRLNLFINNSPRQYTWNGNGPERVLYPQRLKLEGEDNFQAAAPELEEAVEKFVELAFRYARQERFQKNKKGSAHPKEQSPETHRVMSPTRFNSNPAQSRFDFRNIIMRPR